MVINKKNSATLAKPKHLQTQTQNLKSVLPLHHSVATCANGNMITSSKCTFHNMKEDPCLIVVVVIDTALMEK